jgi:hypothetical protein
MPTMMPSVGLIVPVGVWAHQRRPLTEHNSMKPIFWQLLRAVSGSMFGQAAPANVAFSQSAPTVEAYDFVEVTLNVSQSLWAGLTIGGSSMNSG